MLNIVITESELELVPDEALKEKSIVESAKKRNKKPCEILLDSSHHHSAKIVDGWRRGRPDIIHITLQVLQESFLNHVDQLRVWVHTRNDEIISINPETRLPKNYNRFCGLIEKLFRDGIIKSGDEKELLSINKQSIGDFIGQFDCKKLLAHPEGIKIQELKPERDVVVIIGGFPYGGFNREYGSVERVKVAEVELTTWATAMEILCWYESKGEDKRV